MEDVNLSFLNKVICAVTVRSSFHSLVQTPDKITELLTNAKLSEIPCYNNLEYIDVPISYTSFVAKYMFANLPCVLKKWATADWPACRLWTQIEGKKVIPDFCEFKKLCPEIVVPVANCRCEVIIYLFHKGILVRAKFTFVNYTAYFKFLNQKIFFVQLI